MVLPPGHHIADALFQFTNIARPWIFHVQVFSNPGLHFRGNLLAFRACYPLGNETDSRSHKTSGDSRICWCRDGVVMMSGLDCALYSPLMVLFIKREMQSRSWIWIALFSLLLGGLVAKIIYETTTGLTIFVGNTHANMVPVPLAHLVGGCIGFFVGIGVPRRFVRKCTLRGSGYNDIKTSIAIDN